MTPTAPSLDDLLRLLQNERGGSRARTEAISELQKHFLGKVKVVLALRDVVTHDHDPSVVGAAALALVRWGDSDGIIAATQRLDERAFTPHIASALASRLLHLDTKFPRHTFDPVISILKSSKDAALRIKLVTALAMFRDPGTLDALIERAETDPQPAVRTAALRAIRRFPLVDTTDPELPVTKAGHALLAALRDAGPADRLLLTQALVRGGVNRYVVAWYSPLPMQTVIESTNTVGSLA